MRRKEMPWCHCCRRASRRLTDCWFQGPAQHTWQPSNLLNTLASLDPSTLAVLAKWAWKQHADVSGLPPRPPHLHDEAWKVGFSNTLQLSPTAESGWQEELEHKLGTDDWVLGYLMTSGIGHNQGHILNFKAPVLKNRKVLVSLPKWLPVLEQTWGYVQVSCSRIYGIHWFQPSQRGEGRLGVLALIMLNLWEHLLAKVLTVYFPTNFNPSNPVSQGVELYKPTFSITRQCCFLCRQPTGLSPKGSISAQG